ncbi:Alpha/Beta hydrolase protein [Mycena olivaceomarginata]|nr:Alpha/Beta hydrolase protein [Mycena olivaceomarginata]
MAAATMHQFLVLASLALTAVAGLQPSVTIKNGTVSFNQTLFLGIPYAQPPVGDLRLRPPRSINASFGTLDASAYGPHCWSQFTTGFDDNSGFNTSEDCLTLNVIRPTGASEKSLVPVVVWIHGGGLTTGGSSDFRYNGTWLVEASIANGNPIVFVSVNYRLASLGFLASKALADEGSLNLGVRDQRLALHWAGATSVHTQVIAYAGRDDKLFNRVIAESGTDGGNYSLPDSSALQATYNGLLANTSCSSTTNSSETAQLSCLRSLPIDEFRQQSVGPTAIVLDGDFINVPGAFEAYRTGKWVRAAFLVGSNTDEGRSFGASSANTTADVKAALVGSVPDQLIDPILEVYPDSPWLGCPFNTGDFQLDPVQNGAFFGSWIADGPRWLAQEISPKVPFYKYRFNHKPYSVTFSVEDFVGHFIEVAYVFNLQNNDTDFWLTNHFTATYLGPTAPIEDRFLGVYMSRSWASFIANREIQTNANGEHTRWILSASHPKIHWPKYSDGEQNLVWQTQGSVTEKDYQTVYPPEVDEVIKYGGMTPDHPLNDRDLQNFLKRVCQLWATLAQELLYENIWVNDSVTRWASLSSALGQPNIASLWSAPLLGAVLAAAPNVKHLTLSSSPSIGSAFSTAVLSAPGPTFPSLSRLQSLVLLPSARSAHTRCCTTQTWPPHTPHDRTRAPRVGGIPRPAPLRTLTLFDDRTKTLVPFPPSHILPRWKSCDTPVTFQQRRRRRSKRQAPLRACGSTWVYGCFSRSARTRRSYLGQLSAHLSVLCLTDLGGPDP